MSSHAGVQFSVSGTDGVVHVPEAGGMTVAPELCFILPFGLDLHGRRLRYATVQPLTILAVPGAATISSLPCLTTA